MKKIEFNWKIISIALVTIVPFFVNILMIFPYPKKLSVGDVSAWVGFFGNYSGGILGGLVAFGVAKYQIENQEKITEKEKYNLQSNEKNIRRYNQLPALIKVKFLLEQIKSNLTTATALGKKGNIVLDGINNISVKIEEMPLQLQSINKEYILAIESILSVDLQIKLIKLTNFYVEFDGIVASDISENQLQLNKINNKLKYLGARKNPSEKELFEIDDLKIEGTKLGSKIAFISENKKILWKELLKENYLVMTDSILNEVNAEIDEIKKLNI